MRFTPESAPTTEPKIQKCNCVKAETDAQQRGWKTIEYVDHLSGAKESRPQLNQLMADAKAKKFQAVLVWKLDRFGRSLAHLVNALALFEKLEITFVSKQENLEIPRHRWARQCSG